MNADHYIIDTEANGDYVVFERDDHKGYTTDIRLAGKYTKEEALHTQQITHGDKVAISIEAFNMIAETRLVAANKHQIVHAIKEGSVW